MAKFQSTYDNGQMVYLVTDVEQRPRLITGIEFPLAGGPVYALSCGIDVSRHYEAEISTSVNEALRLGIEITSN